MTSPITTTVSQAVSQTVAPSTPGITPAKEPPSQQIPPAQQLAQVGRAAAAHSNQELGKNDKARAPEHPKKKSEASFSGQENKEENGSSIRQKKKKARDGMGDKVDTVA